MIISPIPAAISSEQLQLALTAALPALPSMILIDARTDKITILVNDAEPDAPTQAAVQNVIDGHNTLTLSATLSSITADGVQETVITSAGLNSFDYRVWRNGAIVLSGSINDGSLDFSTNEAGVYLVEFIDGTSTGYKEITATNG